MAIRPSITQHCLFDDVVFSADEKVTFALEELIWEDAVAKLVKPIQILTADIVSGIYETILQDDS